MNPDPPATTIHRARELREEGKSLRAIADILAAESVPLPPGRATKWSHTAVVRLFRQCDTPPAAPGRAGRPAPAAPGRAGRPAPPASPAPPPQPPPPVRLDRDMPPLVGPGWVPEGWRPRLLMGLLFAGLLGASAAALYQAVGPPAEKLRTYQAVWDALTEEQRGQVNTWAQAANAGK